MIDGHVIKWFLMKILYFKWVISVSAFIGVIFFYIFNMLIVAFIFMSIYYELIKFEEEKLHDR